MPAILLQSRNSRISRDHLLQDLQSLALFTPAVVLVPTAGVVNDLRRRAGNSLGVSFFQFYSLGEAVLKAGAHPVHSLSDTAARLVIRKVLEDMHSAGELTTFADVSRMPGFVEVLLEWLREVKAQGIRPEETTDLFLPSNPERDRQLSMFYRHYQEYLIRRHYTDTEGLLWLAAEALEGQPELFRSTGPVYVYGFDQFSPVQLRILHLLMDRNASLRVYLPWDPARSEGGLALARLSGTRRKLVDELEAAETVLPGNTHEPAALAWLQGQIFEKPRPAGSDESIRLVEAPSREAEVRYALREIKQLLLEGTPTSEIALASPHPAAYQPIVRTVAEEYGIPVAWEQPLTGLPPAQSFRDLLLLSPEFSWRGVFSVLRSPYVRQAVLSMDQVDLLDRLSRERPVTGGLAQWRQVLQPVRDGSDSAEDEDRSTDGLASELLKDELLVLETGLFALFALLTPPPEADTRTYVWWVQTVLLGVFPPDEDPGPEEDALQPVSVFLSDCCEDGPYPERDRRAVAAILQALRRLLSAGRAVPEITFTTWEAFREALMQVLGAIRLSPDPEKAGVRMDALAGARARPVDHLFVLGLAEGEFPSPPAPDVLYAPAERAAHPLKLVQPSPADSSSLWWQVVGNAGRTLTLLRPYIDDSGAEWQASPYWQAVVDCFSDLAARRIGIAHHAGVEEAASFGELLAALGAARVGLDTVPHAFRGLWARVLTADSVMLLRASNLPAGIYEGRFASKDLKAVLAARYGSAHVWSASRLNRFADCPYGFFAEKILGLEARVEPEEGLDARQRGSLLHEVLEKLFYRFAKLGVQLVNGSLEVVLKELDAVAREVFRVAPDVYGFLPTTLWHHEQAELLRLLRALLRWECEENGATARFAPYLQEAAFGLPGGMPPLTVQIGEDNFRLRGLIDRLDRDSEGNLRIVDYKSGSTTYSAKDLAKGLALQTALYAMAAEAYWAADTARVAESVYVHIPIRKESGRLGFEGRVMDNDTAFAAVSSAMLSVRQIRDADFPAAPARPAGGWTACRQSCDFAALCRVSRHSIHKAAFKGAGRHEGES